MFIIKTVQLVWTVFLFVIIDLYRPYIDYKANIKSGDMLWRRFFVYFQATYPTQCGQKLLTDGVFYKKRSEEHTSELQSRFDLVCRLLLEKKKNNTYKQNTIRALVLT